MKRWTYAVTFEAPRTRPPDTVRGGVLAGSAYRAASLAIREAKKARSGKRYESLLVLIEPAGDADAHGAGRGPRGGIREGGA